VPTKHDSVVSAVTIIGKRLPVLAVSAIRAKTAVIRFASPVPTDQNLPAGWVLVAGVAPCADWVGFAAPGG